MELLTQEIREAMPALYSGEAIPLEHKLAVCKFFHPASPATWLVAEGEEQDGDYMFFGLVSVYGNMDEAEWGYFTLKQLQDVKVMGLGVERDINFPIKQRKIVEEMRKYAR